MKDSRWLKAHLNYRVVAWGLSHVAEGVLVPFHPKKQLHAFWYSTEQAPQLLGKTQVACLQCTTPSPL